MTRYRQSFLIRSWRAKMKAFQICIIFYRHSQWTFIWFSYSKYLYSMYKVYKQMYKYVIIICWRRNILMQLFLRTSYNGKSNLNSWIHWGYITLSQLLLQLKMSHPFSSTWDLSRRQLSYIKHISLHVTGINHVLRMLNNQIMSWPPDY